MLKIKDSVDLKELEKFGFSVYSCNIYTKLLKNPDNSCDENLCLLVYGNDFRKYKARQIYIYLEDDIEQGDQLYLIDTLYDLIQAGLVEKVEVINND